MKNKVVNALDRNFQFTNGLNVIIGNNGSGKTRLIKAFVDSVGEENVYQIMTKNELLNLYNEDLKDKIVVIDSTQSYLNIIELKEFAKFVSECKGCTFVVSMTRDKELYKEDNLIELQANLCKIKD